MPFGLFKSKWEPYSAAEMQGKYGCASVIIRNLECEKHVVTGALRFKGDFGAYLHQWLTRKWEEAGVDPQRMMDGSPWNWSVQLRDSPPVELQISYGEKKPAADMYSDTLDAIIDALETNAQSPQNI